MCLGECSDSTGIVIIVVVLIILHILGFAVQKEMTRGKE